MVVHVVGPAFHVFVEGLWWHVGQGGMLSGKPGGFDLQFGSSDAAMR